MDRRANKPTKHGADHLPGGQDPIPFVGLQYDTDNEGDWFYGAANVGEVNRDGDGTTVVSWEFSTGSSDAPGLLDGDGGWIIDTAGDISLFAGSTLHLSSGNPIDVQQNMDLNSKRIENLADGVNPQDAATVAQLPGMLSVADGVTTVDPATAIVFTGGAVVTDAGGGVADVFVSGGGGGGTEFDYVERTTNYTNATGAFTSIIDGNAVTYDGSTRIKIEFWAAVCEISASDVNCSIELFDGATDLCELGGISSTTGGTIDLPCYGVRYLTPSAGSHTFHIKGARGAVGSMLIAAGNGSGGAFAPAFMRITQA